MKRCSVEERTMWVEDWRNSGKSIRGYALANGLNPQTFAKWTKPTKETKDGFVQITAPVIPSPPQEMKEILIELRDIKIHLPLSVCRSELLMVIEMLEAVK